MKSLWLFCFQIWRKNSTFNEFYTFWSFTEILDFEILNFWPETQPRWHLCLRHLWCTKRSWRIPLKRTCFNPLGPTHACQKCKWIQGVFSGASLSAAVIPTRAPFSPMLLLAWDYDTSIWRRAGLQVASSNVIIFILPFFHCTPSLACCQSKQTHRNKISWKFSAVWKTKAPPGAMINK